MASSLFNIYDSSTSFLNKYDSTKEEYYSLVFDKQRKSIWVQNTEYGRYTHWNDIDGKPSTFPASAHNHDDRYLRLSGGTMSGSITLNGNPIIFGKSGSYPILNYGSSYPNYGIWYHDEDVDKMTFSASGNANSISTADLAINGAGDGTVTIRGNKILTAGNYSDYTVTKNGAGATGNWAISITGNASTSTSLQGGAAGSIPYQTASDTTAFLAKTSTNGAVLKFDTSTNKPYWGSDNNSDTKNTAGSTNKASTKLFLVGAESQAANPITYSNDKVYIGTDNCLYSNGLKVLTSHQSLDAYAKKDGSNATGNWPITITGNAATATKWQNARTLTIGNTGKSVDGTGNVSWSLSEIGAASSGHTHDDRYLRLSGGTMNDGAQIKRDGKSTSWYTGRDKALIRETSSTGYHPLFSMKTTDGSWELGEYNTSGWFNIPVFTYITDANYNAGSNSTTYQIKFPLATGTVALTGDLTWANISGKPRYATEDPTWDQIRSKPSSSGNSTQPVYWNGSTFVACTAYSSASVNYANYSGYSTRLGGGDIASWGTLTSGNGFSGIAAFDYGDKGAFSWAGKGGQMYMQVDGFFYQNEGRYRVLDENNYTDYTVTKNGQGATGNWSISITGNAASATKWQNARTLTIGNTGKSVDGTGNVSWSLSEIGAASSGHNHDDRYVNVTGDSMSGALWIQTQTKTKSNPTAQQLVINGPNYNESDSTNLQYFPGIGFHLPARTWASLIWNGNFTGVNGSFDGYVGFYGSGFKKHGSSDSYFLLGGGGHTATSNYSLSTHTHTFNLGSTTITTNGGSYTGITGPFNIYTNASPSNAFAICRGSLSEGVQHWVDDSQYHIDYTNDETSSLIHIRIINTDTESPHNPKQTTDYHYYLDCYGNFYSGSNNTGSIGTSGSKWANMYATTFHGSLDGNASSATNTDTVDGYHASGLLTSASLGTNGNSTTISVSVGGTTKTGSVTVPYASSAGVASNISGGAKGSIPYQSAASSTTFLSIGSSGQILSVENGVPVWKDNTSNGVITITKSLKVSEEWMDSGIKSGSADSASSSTLSPGTWLVQISHGTLNSGTDSWAAVYSGIMSLYHGTNSTNIECSDEIVLHRSGHESGKRLYLRTMPTESANGFTKLQIAASAAFSAAGNLTFRFKKIFTI